VSGARRRGAAARAASLALWALAAACGAGKKEPAAGLGKPVFRGPVRALSASADGAWLALLDGCREARGQVLPPQTASCDLRVVAAAGGEARRIAGAVSTLPHAVAWSPSGAVLAAVAEYEYPAARGELLTWSPGAGSPRKLGEAVTFHGFGAHGELGFVAGGRLSVLLPGEPAPREVKGADGIASFDLSPADAAACGSGGGPRVRLVARRSQAAGGQLLASGCDLGVVSPLEKGQVAEYGFSPAPPLLAYTVQGKDGAELKLVSTAEGGAPSTLGRRARAFAFAPSGRSVAFIADAAPGEQGNLHLAELGKPDVLLARDVGELRWAKDAPRLAWLERYDPRVRAGTLGAGGPGLAARTFAANVSDFELSPGGERVAFLQHTTIGGYSVDLGLARLDAPPEAKPEVVARGVFGFAFSPDGKWLYYRTRCVRNAEACDLERIPAEGLAPGARPEVVAPGVKSFEFDPRDAGRLLVGWQRMDMVALDVGVWSGGRLTSVDTAVLPGSARFLGPDSRRLAYVVTHPKRAGVYVAELPR
jgi:WD40 repeat protein